MAEGRSERNAERDDDADTDRPRRRASLEESAKAAAARLEEIHQYLSDLYARREVIAQTVTRGGIQLDWIPVESQLSGERPAEPPSENIPFEPVAGERRERPVQFELEREGAELGPPGTVPAVRLPIELIAPTVALNDWLAKGRHANRVGLPADAREIVPPTESGDHKYAATAQVVTCYGTDGYINAWDPYVFRSDEFSLGQLLLTRGSGTDHQTIEVGCQEYRDIYGDWVPHLFVFYTTNNYTKFGKGLGGYNQNVEGWVQVADTIHPGASITPLSRFDAEQFVLPLKVQLWKGNWWVRVNGVWIGYYPAELFSTAGLRS
ncbi:neprosin family prolyl endopeptidase, partial [Kitasatospora sp. NPDC047058]|uniref:neprosin family prolyl endopeptidase n=1 Tax=Kitasatospora sp. NPDC047058 TaxID=3155620 RepID=UPI00340E61DA